MSVYFSKLKGLSKEFEALVPTPFCNCDKSKEFVLHLQKLKLFQFLMCLNDSYLQARSQILLMCPIPSVNQAYSMIISDERQKYVVATVWILGANPVNILGSLDTILYSRNAPNYKLKRNHNLL